MPQLIKTSDFIGPLYVAALLLLGLGSIVHFVCLLFSRPVLCGLVKAATSATQKAYSSSVVKLKPVQCVWLKLGVLQKINVQLNLMKTVLKKDSNELDLQELKVAKAMKTFSLDIFYCIAMEHPSTVNSNSLIYSLCITIG